MGGGWETGGPGSIWLKEGEPRLGQAFHQGFSKLSE